MTRPRILRRPSTAAAARHPYGLCNLSSSFHKMTKIKQLSKSENKKMLPSTDIDSPVNLSGTQQLKSTSAVIQQYKQKPTANENHITSQQLEPRLVNNDYFVLDGPLVNRREATEQQSLHTISVTLSFAQNLSSLFTCPSSSSSAFEFHFELVGQAVHIKWQHPPTMNTVVNNKAVTIGERATARILCGSSKLLRYLKQSMPQLTISLCNNNGSKISKTIVPVGDRLGAMNDDDCLRLLNENERVINVSGIYQLQNQQSTASQMGVDILISKLGQLPQEEEEQDENQEEEEEEDADIDAETAFCSSPVNLFPAEEEDLQLFLEESSIEELGMAGEKLKTAIRDAHQSELAFRRERRRLIRLFKSVQLIYETKRIDEKRQAAANVIASQMKEKQRLIEKQQLALNAEIQRQEKMARELRNKQKKRKQSKDDQRWTVVPAEDKKEDEEEVEISAKKKKIRFSVLRDTHNIIIPANKRKDISPKSKPIKKAKNKKKIVIQPKTDTATNGETKKKRKYRKRKTNRSPRLKVDEDNSSSDSEEDCCSAQPCLKPEEKKVKWVQCDGTCQLWFHYRCEGLENTDIDAKKDYICRQCRAIQPATEEAILHSKSP